jgi:hypothetical protein
MGNRVNNFFVVARFGVACPGWASAKHNEHRGASDEGSDARQNVALLKQGLRPMLPVNSPDSKPAATLR